MGCFLDLLAEVMVEDYEVGMRKVKWVPPVGSAVLEVALYTVKCRERLSDGSQ